MGVVEKTITGLAAFLWLVPPLVALYIWPLPMPPHVINQVWLHYFAFAIATYVLFRWFDPERRRPLIVAICVLAFAIELFNVEYFCRGDMEQFRTAHFLAALFGTGLGTTLRKFPNRWDNF
jgi:hypothetical protein